MMQLIVTSRFNYYWRFLTKFKNSKKNVSGKIKNEVSWKMPEKSAVTNAEYKKIKFFSFEIWRNKKLVVTLHSQTGNQSREQNRKNDSVAQLVEQMTLNHWVVGSSPTGVTFEEQSNDCSFFVIIDLFCD